MHLSKEFMLSEISLTSLSPSFPADTLYSVRAEQQHWIYYAHSPNKLLNAFSSSIQSAWELLSRSFKIWTQSNCSETGVLLLQLHKSWQHGVRSGFTGKGKEMQMQNSVVNRVLRKSGVAPLKCTSCINHTWKSFFLTLGSDGKSTPKIYSSEKLCRNQKFITIHVISHS